MAAVLPYVMLLAQLTRVSPSVTYRNVIWQRIMAGSVTYRRVKRIVAGDVRGGCSTLRDAAGTADTCLSLGDVS